MKVLFGILVIWLNSSLSNSQTFAPVGNGFSNGEVKSLALDSVNGLLYAIGTFTTTTNGLTVNKAARWNGLVWDSIYSGLNSGSVGFSVGCYNNLVYFGGSFQSFGGIPDTGLAIFDGTNLLSSNSVIMSGGYGGTRGIISSDNNLYIVGYRGRINGSTFNQVAKWDGVAWLNYPMLDSLEGWPALTAVDYNNELYVGGNFEGYGSPFMKDIAKFNGSVWVPVSNGFSGFNSYITELKIYNGKLIVGGGFKTINGDPGNSIAAWDGNSWSQLGSGIDGIVTCLEVVGNDLYVGGFFNTVGGMPINNLARWDGTQWHSLGAVFDNGGGVLCLEQMNNELYIGGGFPSINGISMNHIAKYSIPTGSLEIHQLDNTIKVYPNLTSGPVSIEINSGVISKIRIFDITGKNIHTLIGEGTCLTIDLSDNPSGFYIIKAETSIGIFNKNIFLMSKD